MAATTTAAAEASPSKPYAANEALVPAARVKLTIDRAISLTEKLNVCKNQRNPNNSNSTNGNNGNGNDTMQRIEIVQELDNLLLKPQNYVGSLSLQGVPKTPAKAYLESYKSMSGDLPLQRFLIQNGDVSTWKDLKRKEKLQESEDEVRAALNAYTDVLLFSGKSYLLNVDKKTQSNMVREDALPELKQVITSDMGVRYLYRNQLLTNMEDAKAELKYQLKAASSSGSSGLQYDAIEADDLLELLTEARKSCDLWLSLIDPNDVRLALETAS
eukprot:CAMPEP_0194118930 /NCGR_PEP_ID=MMETSP0150-20130528/37398_1 /TAXON_ID=122233 /ORGANISM="Chaetoceros debilis, Strain MM31A-1" /LENGTH=271 /DNA_ID=CAMNT_0038810465 /DNA_START=404 /DNA_END=1215 /DNA_ORIENTATION=+